MAKPVATLGHVRGRRGGKAAVWGPKKPSEASALQGGFAWSLRSTGGQHALFGNDAAEEEHLAVVAGGELTGRDAPLRLVKEDIQATRTE